jgi:hypothetical protein
MLDKKAIGKALLARGIRPLIKSKRQKMNPKAKVLWLDALYRKLYAQGRGTLCNIEDKMCCLGVLTDVGIRAGAVDVEWKPLNDLSLRWGIVEGPLYDVQVSYLAEPVQEWAQLEEDNPIIGERKNCNSWEILYASEANDDESLNFREIAYLIEHSFK